jgi:hypothetical protein
MPDSLVVFKIIDLSIGGRWGADAPGYLQNAFREYIKQFPTQIFDALDFYSDGKQLRFWQFIYSNPVRKKIFLEMVLNLVEQMDGEKYRHRLKIMCTAFDFANDEESPKSR